MTRLLPADPDTIAEAAALLRAGSLVALPTETVYGLGADARSDAAVAKIYEAKSRPRFNPLIAHVDSLAAARREGLFGDAALALALAFWPGPLTLVVPVAPTGTVSALARAGLASVALRVPSHPIARAVLAEAAIPVAAPSANRSGRISPTSAAHVAAELAGRVDLVLDGGNCPVGVESTILSCLDDGVVLLRPGGLPREAIETVLGRPIATRREAGAAPTAPGLLASHYAPRAAVRLNARAIEAGEVGLGFAGGLPGAALDLSPAGDLVEAATNLFAFLRRLDETRAGTIAVGPIPEHGLGEAINDRLRRAAAPRDG